MKDLTIASQIIRPGESAEININIARLPSRTLIDTPIYVFRGLEDGPVLSLTAGMHGDEINGMEIVRRILDNGYNKVKRGTVLCMPIINMYGFLNYSREVPDGKDINRSFPGSKGGSLASRVAWHVTHEIIPAIDYGIDFHTGGCHANKLSASAMCNGRSKKCRTGHGLSCTVYHRFTVSSAVTSSNCCETRKRDYRL
ncbi:MAG: succinylglutamate desuccinylase/aspartoacylase family protein [Cytophagales bacterium]|nr:succinylglutamate desuccinylase/aspartoacylase family protein [Cytophagales bacterium]